VYNLVNTIAIEWTSSSLESNNSNQGRGSFGNATGFSTVLAAKNMQAQAIVSEGWRKKMSVRNPSFM